MNLKDRVVYGHGVRDAVELVEHSSSRPSKYKSWDEVKMAQAFTSVTQERMSIREAALQYGVPKSTLGDRLTGRVLSGATSGPQTYLDKSEEEELVQFLLRSAEIGYAKSRKQVLALVRRLLQKKGEKSGPVTSGWWASFCDRHPNLTLRAPAPLSKARAAASDPTMLDHYFDLLHEVLDKNGLLDQPCQIFNMDETGMPLNAVHVKIVTRKGDRNPIAPSSGDKSQITVVACVNAAGSAMPPMVILDRKTLPPRFTDGEIPGTGYGLSAKGWIDQELFDGWFTDHFLKYAPMVRPLLLLLDGHSSHYCPDTIRLAAKEKVIIFALPPNTTHITQPLDKGCFGPLKTCWKEECHNYMTANPGKVINRYVFSNLLSKAWVNAMTMRNITGGFKVCGVCPFNRAALKIPLKEQPKVMEALAKESGLAYIPLYSPAKLHGKRSSSQESESCSSHSSCHCDQDSSWSCGSFHYSQNLGFSSPKYHSRRPGSSSPKRGHPSRSQRPGSSSPKRGHPSRSQRPGSSSPKRGHPSHSRRPGSSSPKRGRPSRSRRPGSSSPKRGHPSRSRRPGSSSPKRGHPSRSRRPGSSSPKRGHPSHSRRPGSSSPKRGRPSRSRRPGSSSPKRGRPSRSRRPGSSSPKRGHPSQSLRPGSSSPKRGHPSRSRYHCSCSPEHGHPSRSRRPGSSSPKRGHPSRSRYPASCSPEHGHPSRSRYHCSSSPKCGRPSRSRRPGSSSPKRGHPSRSRYPASCSPEHGHPSRSRRPGSSSPKRGRPSRSRRPGSSSPKRGRPSRSRYPGSSSGYSCQSRCRSSSKHCCSSSACQHFKSNHTSQYCSISDQPHSSIQRHYSSSLELCSKSALHSLPSSRESSPDYLSPPFYTGMKSSLSRRSSSCPKYHSSSGPYMLEAHCGSLSSLLTLSEMEKPKVCVPPKKSHGRVLTSIENIRAIEEKERKKQEKAQLKEERKRQMKRKREEKAKLVAERKKKIEAKKAEKDRVQRERSQLQNKRKPAKKKGKEAEGGQGSENLSFTEKEIQLFETRYENGYDLTTDKRYNAWLRAKGRGDVELSSTRISLESPNQLDDPPYNYSFDDSMFDLSVGTRNCHDLPGPDWTGENLTMSIRYNYYSI